MNLKFAGVGNRLITPEGEERIITVVSTLNNWCLRSGGATGSDSIFEAHHKGFKEIFEPKWISEKNPKYNKTIDLVLEVLVEASHPVPINKLDPYVLRLHKRNGLILLGADIKEPVSVVVCWTRDGVEVGEETTSVTGGTGTLIRMATKINIPVLNLAKRPPEEVITILRELEANALKKEN